MKLPEKECECGTVFTQFNSLNRFCSYTCKARYSKKQDKKPPKTPKPIRKFSEKRTLINNSYKVIRIEVLTEANFICFIDGCQNTANTIEHTAGRLGFYDEWARDNNIPLIIDKRFLKACCLYHNGELETNTELSKKYQLSKIHGGKK